MSEEKTTSLTDSALGLARIGNQMKVFRIKYNPETQEVGSLEIVATEDTQDNGEKRFKIMTVKEGLLK